VGEGLADIVQGFRQALQDILTPEVRELKAEVRGLRGEMSVLREEMNARMEAISEKFTGLNDKFSGLRTEMHSGFQMLQMSLENAVLRGDKENIREMADLRERVTRLESHAPRSLPQ
jgi:metal-responsive CopG/Arc/MetJ family transcriptional regulator